MSTRRVRKPVSEKIADALGAAEETIQKVLPVKEVVKNPTQNKDIVPSKISEDAKEDYDFARKNLYSLLHRGNKILDGVQALASEAESPRVYEVAGNIIKILIEGNKELISLQQDIRNLEGKTSEKDNVKIENAENVNYILEASSHDVLEYMLNKKKIEKEKEI